MFTYKFVHIFLVVRRGSLSHSFFSLFYLSELRPQILGTETGSDHSAMPLLTPPLLTLSPVTSRMEIQVDVHAL